MSLIGGSPDLSRRFGAGRIAGVCVMQMMAELGVMLIHLYIGDA